jgi:hypothetical protein
VGGQLCFAREPKAALSRRAPRRFAHRACGRQAALERARASAAFPLATAALPIRCCPIANRLIATLSIWAKGIDIE